MDTLAELLRESILVQALITAIVVITLCAMYLLQRPIPSDFLIIASSIISFYFGQRSSARADTVLTKAQSLIKAKDGS